jgi:lipopolysaccharide transport system ATP-binding protein
MSLAIQVENLSKAYQLGTFGTGTLSRDIERKWAKMRGKEDPFLNIVEENGQSHKGLYDMVWSLKDINFSIDKGEAVGIIGRNGAGKSTLLKLLSQITSPTTGIIKIKGRIASLLEVGTGFHPELTGRENIYLNGAILGMRKKEIDQKFDEIVDFSGVEKYIDTPVKRYSSGMYVRLAFSVAAHLESEILIVDEVLAVGDQAFQNKCLERMDKLSYENKTILFVSHNISAIERFCKKSILLEGGKLFEFGLTNQIIKSYSDLTSSISNSSALDLSKSSLRKNSPDNSLAKFNFIEILNSKKERTNDFFYDEKVFIRLSIEMYKDSNLLSELGIAVSKNTGILVFNDFLVTELQNGINEYEVILDNQRLSPGTYDIGLGLNGSGITDWFPIVTSFIIREWDINNEITIHPKFNGVYIPSNNWLKIK